MFIDADQNYDAYMKSAISSNPTPKMLLWLHIAELINKGIITKFLDVHTINIWSLKPHGIGSISTGSHGIRLYFSLEKNVVSVSPPAFGEIIIEYEVCYM